MEAILASISANRGSILDSRRAIFESISACNACFVSESRELLISSAIRAVAFVATKPSMRVMYWASVILTLDLILSLVFQGHRRIHRRRTTRGDDRRNYGDRHQQRGHAAEHRRVRRLHAE